MAADMREREYDAVVVGSGPNGLAAAVALARAGRSVLVLEAAGAPGGGMRSEPLTLPGFVHDVCSAVHPLGVASPFFRRLPLAAHATLGLRRPPSAAFGLILGVAGHAVGWPVPRGGSGSIAAALVSYLRSLGGEVVTGARVGSLDDLPRAGAILLDVTPRQLLRLAGGRLPFWYRKQLEWFRYGLGTFKLDWALDGPIPWRAPECARAATVHLGGTLVEMEEAREAEWQGRPAG